MLFALMASPLARPADAEWRAVSPPAGGIRDLLVADSSAWLVQPPGSSTSFSATDDGGLSWTTGNLADFNTAYPVGAVADRTFRLLALRSMGAGRELQVFRVSASGAVTPLGPLLSVPDQGFHSRAFGVSDAGDTWIAHYDDGAGEFVLTIVGADGSIATKAIPSPSGDPDPASERWRVWRTVFGLRLQREALGIVYRDTYRLNDAGQVVGAEAYPVEFVDGRVWLSPRYERASWDGGAHWGRAFLAFPVPRAPGLGMPRYLAVAGVLAERYSPALYRKSGLDLHDGIVDTGAALVARDESQIYVSGAGLPSLPTAMGPLEADTQKLLARVNLLRADAGFLPLVGDPTISQASRNHSRYSLLNPEETARGEPHSEIAGHPGFTGSTPAERCQAVGAECGGEVMFGPDARDPVGGWLASVYHRPLLGSPAAGVVGAGRVDGGHTVANADWRDTHNLIVAPIGFPNGRWRGESGFSGEWPDPVVHCRERGNPIQYPVGITVSLYLPGDELSTAQVTDIDVRVRGAGTLPGCLINREQLYQGDVGHFVLDDPLVPGQTYDVTARWTPEGDFQPPGGAFTPGPTLSETWSFTFEPDGYSELIDPIRCRGAGVGTLRPYKPRLRRSQRRGARKAVGVRFAVHGATRIRVRRAVLLVRLGQKLRRVVVASKAIRAKTLELAGRSFVRFFLPAGLARNLPLGRRLRLKVKLTATPTGRAACRQALVVRRTARTRVVLTPKRGPAAGPLKRGRGTGASS